MYSVVPPEPDSALTRHLVEFVVQTRRADAPAETPASRAPDPRRPPAAATAAWRWRPTAPRRPATTSPASRPASADTRSAPAGCRRPARAGPFHTFPAPRPPHR